MFGGVDPGLVITAVGGVLTGVIGSWATIRETRSQADVAVHETLNSTLSTMSEALDKSLDRTARHSQDITNLSTQLSTQGVEISEMRRDLRRNEAKFDSSCVHIARREHWARLHWPEGRPPGLPVIPPDIVSDVDRAGRKVIEKWGTINGGQTIE